VSGAENEAALAENRLERAERGSKKSSGA